MRMIRSHSWPLLTDVFETPMMDQETVDVKTGTMSFDCSLGSGRLVVGQRNGVFYSLDEDHPLEHTDLPHSIQRQYYHSFYKRTLGAF